MILEIYVFLISVSLLFVFLGFYLKGDVDAFKFVGFLFIFLLGGMLMPNSPIEVEYKTGAMVTNSDGNYTITNTYDVYQSFTIGLYISILGAIGFVSSFLMRNDYEQEQ